MKPENVKYLLNCYLKGKHEPDDVDGIHHRYASRSISAECSISYGDKYSGIEDLEPQSARLVGQGLQHDGVQNFEAQNARPVAYDLLHYAPLNRRQEAIAVEVARQIGDMSNRFVLQRPNSREAADKESQAIQFKQRHLFVNSNCGKIQIPVHREGNTDKTSKVMWKTSNGTAVFGRNFIGDSGELFFSEGEVEKVIEIQIINYTEGGNFAVQLYASGDTYVGPMKSIVLSIVDHENLYPVEKQVVENIVKCNSSARFSSVVCCLRDCITPRTFLAGLQFLCGHADSIPEQLYYAFELTRFLLPKARREILFNTISNFFQNLPELEELGQSFEGLH